MDEVDLAGLEPVTDPALIAKLELPQSTINKSDEAGDGPAYSQSALDAFDRAIASAVRLKTHPGYGAAVGSAFDPQSWGSFNPFTGQAFGGTNARDFGAELEAMKAQVFLPMVQSMKGMGALSNAEGQKLTDAIGALDTGMSEDAFRTSLDRIIGDLTSYRNRGAPKDGQGAAAGSVATTAPAAPTVGAGPAAPLDPEGIGDIGFASQASNDANSLPARAQEVQREIQTALDTGQIRTAEEIIRFGQVRGFDISPEEAKAAADWIAKGGKGVQVNTPTFVKPDISGVRGEGDLEEIVRAALRGIPAAAGIDDELGAAATTMFDGGTMRENLAHERAIRDYDEENNFLPRLTGSLATAPFIPSSAQNAARTAAVGALRSGLGREAAIEAARRTFAARLGMEGGAYSAGYGFLSEDGSVADRAAAGAVSAPVGAITAAGAGYFGGKLLDKLKGKPKVRAATETATETAADAVDRALDYGIDLPLDSAGGRGARIVGNTLSNLPGSAQVMNQGRQRVAGQVESSVDNVADKFGAANSFMAAGEAVRRGAKNWIGRFEKVSSKVYDAIPINAKAGATLDNTRDALERLTTIFQSNPKMEAAFRNSRLHTYMDALAEKIDDVDEKDPLGGVLRTVGRTTEQPTGQLSWEDLKTFRSIIGEQIGEVRFSDTPRKGELRSLYAALSEDMKATARQQGPSALRAFERANNLYRQGQQRIDNALVSILGDDGQKSPEAAARVLQTIAKAGKGSSDLGRLAEIRKSMPADEWGEVASSLVRLLGQPANSEGRDFSAQTFIRNFDDMSDGAKNLLFGDRGRKELRSNLEEFSKTVRQLAETDALRNTSNAAGQVLTGLGLFSLGNLPAVAGQAAISFGMAKAFTNPRFVQWATGYTKMLKGAAKAGSMPNGQNMARQAELLRKVAVAEPAIAQEALGIRQALLGAANDNAVAAAAASPEAEANQQDQAR